MNFYPTYLNLTNIRLKLSEDYSLKMRVRSIFCLKHYERLHLEFGVDWIEVEQTLVAVTAQRLVELSCTHCITDCTRACHICEMAKKACVFEILAGQALSHVINEAKGEKRAYNYATLRKVISKGIALGFIKETEYERWVLDHEG